MEDCSHPELVLQHLMLWLNYQGGAEREDLCYSSSLNIYSAKAVSYCTEVPGVTAECVIHHHGQVQFLLPLLIETFYWYSTVNVFLWRYMSFLTLKLVYMMKTALDDVYPVKSWFLHFLQYGNFSGITVWIMGTLQMEREYWLPIMNTKAIPNE